MRIDFHSHILPMLDDGARSVEESISILDKMAMDAVDIVVATPHFYSYEQNIDSFIDKRNASYEMLKPHLTEKHPKILLGAEVLYNNIFVNNDSMTKLCIEGTDYLLLEMPYEQISDSVVNKVAQIADSMDIKLIIAHIERYLKFTSYKELSNLLNLDVLGQINVKSLLNRGTKKDCFKLIKDGFVHVLGTDYHRIDSGHKLFGETVDVITKKFGEDYLAQLETNSEKILKNCDIYDIFYR